MQVAAIWTALLVAGQLQWIKESELDLDGDGKVERITLTEKPGAFLLKVGAASLEQKTAEYESAAVAVVDVDQKDKLKELLIDAAPDAGDDHQYTLVRYQGGKLTVLGTFGGTLPSEPTIPGNGSIRLEPWFGFFKTTDKLELSGGKLVRVEQAFFYAGVRGKPKGSPKMFRTPERTGLVGVLTAGQEIDILGYRPSKADCKRKSGFKTCDAFLVKSSSGLVGWISFEDLEEESLPWAG